MLTSPCWTLHRQLRLPGLIPHFCWLLPPCSTDSNGDTPAAEFSPSPGSSETPLGRARSGLITNWMKASHQQDREVNDPYKRLDNTEDSIRQSSWLS